MEGSNGKTFVTDQYIILSQGKQEKEFPMIACSQSDFTNVSPKPLSLSLLFFLI